MVMYRVLAIEEQAGREYEVVGFGRYKTWSQVEECLFEKGATPLALRRAKEEVESKGNATVHVPDVLR